MYEKYCRKLITKNFFFKGNICKNLTEFLCACVCTNFRGSYFSGTYLGPYQIYGTKYSRMDQVKFVKDSL